MNSPFVFDECNRQQNKRHDQDDALFVFRELKNSQEALHLLHRSFGVPFMVLSGCMY